MTFKVKDKKKKIFNTTITLGATHNNKLNEINDKHKQTKLVTNKINLLTNKLNSLKQKTTDLNLDERIDITDELNLLQIKKKELEKNDKDINYLLDNKNILLKYYEYDSGVKVPIKKTNFKDNSIVNFFNKKSKEKTIDKKDLFETYLSRIDNNYSSVKHNKISDKCINCNIEKILYLGIGKKICHKCGDETDVLIESDKPSYKDPPYEITYFSYKRINHFNEWLAQFQAKETTDISKDIYEEIIDEIKKERLDINKLSASKLRSILKKIKKNKYYEHIPHILNKLNGINPPIMSSEIEEELRRMFKEIQIPFHKFCPKERKNFLSYSYVLHKFVELLELDEFIICFVLLKSREKLHQQDLIWKQICEYLDWQFIASI